MSNRLAKVNSLIKQELGTILQMEIDRPKDFLVTPINVDTSVDLRYTTVFITVTPANKSGSALRYLRANLAEMQRHLHSKLVMRPLPKIKFKIDQGERHASRIEQIIAKEKFGKDHE